MDSVLLRCVPASARTERASPARQSVQHPEIGLLQPAQRLKKFDVCTRGLLEPAAAQRVIECVERLDTSIDVVEIMDLVRCDAA